MSGVPDEHPESNGGDERGRPTGPDRTTGPDASTDPTDPTAPTAPTDTTDKRDPGGPSEADPSSGSPGRATLKGALLWGVVAALAFLVLAQGYQLLEFGTLPVTVSAVGTVAVFVVTALLTYLLGP